ncbi:MAG TPA: amidohydrolase family protein, partial [Trueperaceae bacterium]|nr:amidohydrolase family protein [Trueperaceae bacterium]
ADVGMSVDGPEVLAERLPLAIEAGLTPVVHAIGDAATRAVVEAFATLREELQAAGLRPRLEHAQHMHEDDVARAGGLGLITSLQPIHLTFDVAGIQAVLSDRVERAYPMRSLLRTGARLAFGSDAPVASPDVFAGLRAACRRASPSGVRLNPQEAISPDQALAAYTTGGAFAIGREERSGMLREGFDADLVILSHDPLVGLDGLSVVATLKGGQPTFGDLPAARY